jgi:hypothetical protein
MVTSKTIIELVKPRLNRVLTVAEAALPERQFSAFRKFMLDEFGKSGLERDLEQAYHQQDKDRTGMGGNK